jgi:hypothetical protein
MPSNLSFFTSSIKVVILSRNRWEYLLQSLQSVLESAKHLPKYVRCNIEISDNSDSDNIVELIKRHYPQVSISLRRPNITVINHFKKVVYEANSDYLVMFHDDDIMKPGFLSKLYELLVLNPEVAAVGCNAYYMRNNADTNFTFMNKNEDELLIDNIEKLLNGYFLIGKRGTSPFPGYMYQVKYIDESCLDERKGGIHADLSFLLDVVQRASILLTSEILMSYRLHETNVNNESTVRIQRGLLRYLKNKIPIEKSQALQDFRYTIMIRWFREQHIKIGCITKWSYRQKIIFKYIISELFKHLLRPDCMALHLQVMRDKYIGNLLAKFRVIRQMHRGN